MGTLDERSRVEDNLISEIDIGRRNSKQPKMKFIMCLAVAVALLVTLTPASAVDRQERDAHQNCMEVCVEYFDYVTDADAHCRSECAYARSSGKARHLDSWN